MTATTTAVEKTIRHVVSFGAGLNSSAMLPYLLFDKKQEIDLVVFADTGNENDYTYDNVKIYEEWCNRNGINFKVARSQLDNNLYDYCIRKKITPSRLTRNCTRNFKINPIRKTIRNTFEIDKNTIIKLYIAITSDEVHRVRDSDVKYIQNTFPFVDDNISRNDCVDILKRHNLPIAKKSGCWFCPFHKKKEWVQMLEENPELYNKSITLEENSKYFPKEMSLLSRIPLRKIRYNIMNQSKLTDFEFLPFDVTCDVSGSCFL